jgi:ferredoxin-NADP reductase
MVSSRLDRPVLQRTPADDVLNNIFLSGPTPRLGVEYFNLPEERMSAGIQVEMEHAFAPALESMGNIQKYIAVEDDPEITRELCNIMSAIVGCARVFLSTRCQNTTDGLDFVIWGATYPEIGRAVYPGALNNSGVNSPLFHALDTFIRIEDVDHELYRQQLQRRALLPLPVRLFIDALGDRRYCIRSYANNRKHSAVAAAFNALIQTYSWLLGLHRMRAVGGITIAEASGRQRTAGGMHSGNGITLDEIINRQMTRSIVSRIGSQPQTLAATVVAISQSGRRSSRLTLEYAFALPARAGDRIQVWPERQSADGQHRLASLRPRHYSVADSEARGMARRVSLTIAHSEGLCGRFLRSCVPGQEIRTRLMPAPGFWSPDDCQLPLLLIAQGVGIGPFFGFLRHRCRVREGGGVVGKVMLIVGAEDVEDTPYFSEVDGLTRALPLEVYCALSRTNKPVAGGSREVQCFGAVRTDDLIQHLQEKIRADVFTKGGHTFVCGSARFGTTTRSALHVLHLVEPSRYHEDCFGGRTAGKTRTTTITIAELMHHNRPHDLWLAIDGVVYDLTAFSATHPGGLKTLVECAGMPADRRFSQIHGGDAGQGILAQMGQYAIGVVDFDADLSSPWMQTALGVVQMQNVLTNCTFFAPGRAVPFYVFAESLLLVWDSTRRLCTSLRGGRLTPISTQQLDEALETFKEQGWRYLGEGAGLSVSGEDLERRIARRELRLRVAYSTVWEQFHGFFDRLKLYCVQHQKGDAGFAEGLDGIWQGCLAGIQESVHRAIGSLRRDIEEESIQCGAISKR